MTLTWNNLLSSWWQRYLHTSVRTIGPLPLWGRIKRGGAFPSAEGRLFGFLHTNRNKTRLTYIKHSDISPYMYKNHTTSLWLRKCTPSAFGISPDGGEVLRTYHWYIKNTATTRVIKGYDHTLFNPDRSGILLHLFIGICRIITFSPAISHPCVAIVSSRIISFVSEVISPICHCRFTTNVSLSNKLT